MEINENQCKSTTPRKSRGSPGTPGPPRGSPGDPRGRRTARSAYPPPFGVGVPDPPAGFTKLRNQKLLKLKSGFPSPKPSPGGCAFRRAALILTICGASFAFLAEKSCSKRHSKNDQMLMPFQHRFLSVLTPFLETKMAPKSIKNRSKLGFRAFLFPHRFLHRFLTPT